MCRLELFLGLIIEQSRILGFAEYFKNEPVGTFNSLRKRIFVSSHF